MGLLRHKHFWISRCRHGRARIAVCGTDIAVTAMVTMVLLLWLLWPLPL